MTWFTAFLGMFPLWAFFTLTLSISIAQVEFGSYLARLVLQRKLEKDPEGPLGALVGALLGLLAFILAFTFSIAGSRFDTRRQLVLDEANAIGTTYLRAELMPPAQGTEIKRLLREYVDVRLNIGKENVDDVLKKSAEIHQRLWSQTKQLAALDQNMDSELRSLFVDSLNSMIDLHQSRITVGLDYRVPGSIWAALYSLSALAMLAVGYQVGMSGVRRLRGTPIVAAAFALVIAMIADIDRPGEGLMRISQKPIADVRASMQSGSP